MSKPINPRKLELLELLGIEDSKKNYTLAELEELWASRQKKTKKKEFGDLVAGSKAIEEDTLVPITAEEQSREDPLDGLTDRQKNIARMALRGLTQAAIAAVIGVSQVMISKELAKVRAFQESRGAGLNQAGIIGESASIYEEIEYQAWQTYYHANEPGDKAKLLETVMKARAQQTKLLMDVGLVKKTGSEIKHTLEVSPFIQAWKDKKSVGDSLVSVGFKALPEPSKDEIVDAVFEDPSDNEVEVSELEEPTLEIEEDNE